MSKEKKQNPIDPDLVAEHPGLLPYAHHLGSAIIAPIDEGRTKGLAMSAMYEQTDTQLRQIKEQVETLVSQAQRIHNRIQVSELIYQCNIPFDPVIGKTYHVYQNGESYFLSMITPEEWGSRKKFDWLYEVKLLSDHTWEVVKSSENASFV